METLPGTFWFFYCSFLLFTFITGMIYWVKEKYSIPAVIAIVLSMITPLVAFIFSVQRPNAMNQWNYLFAQIKQGDWWALAISLAFLYLVSWSSWLAYLWIQWIIRNKDEVKSKFQRKQAS